VAMGIRLLFKYITQLSTTLFASSALVTAF